MAKGVQDGRQELCGSEGLQGWGKGSKDPAGPGLCCRGQTAVGKEVQVSLNYTEKIPPNNNNDKERGLWSWCRIHPSRRAHAG